MKLKIDRKVAVAVLAVSIAVMAFLEYFPISYSADDNL
jgi:hypothetical protein